ncbi:MAG TPA: penicillin-binding protein 2 [Thermoleophilaceae bacterium]|jgi:cell division protein FtsI/penicillin-binding protein 2
MGLLERRIGLLFGLFLLLLVLAGFRATYLVAFKGDDLRGRAAQQQVQEFVVPARRGAITDRAGRELAMTEDAATISANPRQVPNAAVAATRISAALGMPLDPLLRKLSDRRAGFVYLARKVEVAKGDAVRKLELAGVSVTTEHRRRYPHGSLASQLVGAVGTDGYGLAGIEQSREKTLHGKDGMRRIVSDALGDPVSIVDLEQARPGEDVRLTIDSAIQERVESVLSDVGRAYQPKGATALVLDPRNGEILSLANWPPVQAERFGDAPAYARQNRAVGASYEPGSTFKPFTVAGAMTERLVTPNTLFQLGPTIQVADREIRESHGGGGTLTTADILAQSSNVGTVTIGLRMGARRFDKWVRRFGFGGSTGVDIPGEASGIVPRPKDYSGSSMGNLPIGQGLAVTPMQMAAAYQAIANGGVMRPPHVIGGKPGPARRVIQPQVAAQVSRMLEGVLGPGGTAREANIDGYVLAGKTGTAEKAENGGYSKTKYVASFIGFAPAKKPRLLVAVMVDEPKGAIYGGQVAAPAFQKIASFALPYLRIPPG